MSQNNNDVNYGYKSCEFTGSTTIENYNSNKFTFTDSSNSSSSTIKQKTKKAVHGMRMSDLRNCWKELSVTCPKIDNESLRDICNEKYFKKFMNIILSDAAGPMTASDIKKVVNNEP